MKGILYIPLFLGNCTGGIASIARKGPSGTAAARLGITRSGCRVTSVKDTVANRTWTFEYAADGSLKRDGYTGYYYADNLLGQIAQVGTPISHSIDYNTLARYIYLADGTKLEAGLEGGASILYRGSFTYKKNADGDISLESIAVPGGMVFVSGSTWTPCAVVTDRLGSVRAIVNMASGVVAERNDYYSYGTPVTQPGDTLTAYPQLTANRWRFSGKEEQDGVTGLPYQDFGARHFDPFNPRWITSDPLAADYPSVNPYTFCAADPVNLVDPDGRILSDYYNLNGKHVHIEDNNDVQYLVITDSNLIQDILSAVSGGLYSLLPTTEIIDQMEKANSITEKEGVEVYFRVSQNNILSQIKLGTDSMIPREAIQMTEEEFLFLDEKVAYDVHTHPRVPEKDSSLPSDADKINAVGGSPSIVLGYSATEYISSFEPSRYSYTPTIVFYNSNGVIASPIPFSSFKNTIKRVSKKLNSNNHRTK